VHQNAAAIERCPAAACSESQHIPSHAKLNSRIAAVNTLVRSQKLENYLLLHIKSMKAEWPLRRSDHQMSTGDALKISATLRKTQRVKPSRSGLERS
jgi:hypothetical protein